jgi:hypothetical protein
MEWESFSYICSDISKFLKLTNLTLNHPIKPANSHTVSNH